MRHDQKFGDSQVRMKPPMEKFTIVGPFELHDRILFLGRSYCGCNIWENKQNNKRAVFVFPSHNTRFVC